QWWCLWRGVPFTVGARGRARPERDPEGREGSGSGAPAVVPTRGRAGQARQKALWVRPRSTTSRRVSSSPSFVIARTEVVNDRQAGSIPRGTRRKSGRVGSRDAG